MVRYSEETAWEKFESLPAVRGLVSDSLLSEILNRAQSDEVSPFELLVTEGHLDEQLLASLFGETLGIPVVREEALKVDSSVADALPPAFGVQRRIIPLRKTSRSLEVAAANPFDQAARQDIKSLTGLRPVMHVATATQIRQAWAVHFGHSDRLNQVSGLNENETAARVMTRPQVLTLAGIALFIAVLAALWPTPTVIGLVAVAFAFFGLSSAHKLNLAVRSIVTSNDEVVTQEELDSISDVDLPMYTVLVPLYREGDVVPQLVSALGALDYPKNKLEVLLLLEEDDEETRRAVSLLQLPPYFQRLVVPNGSPKGKPRALNYGLLYARGEYCCIYDAEDVPDPRQLKKVARVFQRSSDEVLCIQCKLDFYNPGQNALTNMFTLDYSTWFDLVLPGLHSQDLPIPLGGTSNHFRVDGLRRVGAWDAFNVTEDLDLGMRLHRAGYRTVTVDSVTMEEATSGVKAWIGQRTRWLKGYMVTYLVHMRRPVQLWKDLGPSGFISTQLLIGGGVLAPLLSPIFWGLLLVWYMTEWSQLEAIFAGPLLYVGTFLLFGLTYAFVWLAALAGLRRGKMYSVKYALLLPVYWAFMSYAAYRAIYELAVSPHYWEKTRHGMFMNADDAPEEAVAQ